MVFSSIIFLVFFLPITFFLVLIIRSIGKRGELKGQNILLLSMSLVFYAWGEPLYVLLMIGSIFVNFLIGKALGRTETLQLRKIFVVFAVLINLGLLIVFKYASMVTDLFNWIIPFSNTLIPSPEIRLPIGISFFTFQALSYVIDVYRKEVPVQRKLLELGLYISFFPQLIAGPIVRYHDINQQLNNRTITKDDIFVGLKRFFYGLAKKVLIANVVARVADEIFLLDTNLLSTPIVWIGVVAYSLQIYFDFSGYSDMAIGLGRIFGFRFLENFDYPYISSSIQEFWRRWHISLSSWFRDYLYIPLGGNQKGKIRTYINQLIVFLLCGLWHGASWTFVLWGLFHGLFLTIEKLFLSKLLKRIPKIISHIYAIVIVMIGWILFRSQNLPQAWSFISGLFGFGSGKNSQIWKYLEDWQFIIVLLAGICLSMPIIKQIERITKSLSLRKINIKIQKILLIKYFVIFVLIICFTFIITYPRIYNNENNGKTSLYIESDSIRNEVFWAYPGEHFTGNQSLKFDNDYVEIPNINNLEKIRIDAFLKEGDVWTINSIKIVNNKESYEIQGDELLNAITMRSSHLSQPIMNSNGNVLMSISGRDPFFTLDLGMPLSDFLNKTLDFEQNKKQYLLHWKISNFIVSALVMFLLVFLYKKRKKQLVSDSYEISISNIFYLVIFFLYVFVLLWILGSLASSTYNPFIYYRF